MCPVGARNMVVHVDQDVIERPTLLSHDRIVGTHTLRPRWDQ